MARPPYALPAPSPLFPRHPPPLSLPEPPTADYPKEPLLSFDDIATSSIVAADILTLACFVVFTFLIGSDVWSAFKKRAAWLPGKAFALSGVTVQIIVWWTSLSNIQTEYERDIRTLLYSHYLVVTGRVAVCVFIAYLLPGMAAPSVRAFGALALTISAQIASELLLLYNPIDTESESRCTNSEYVDLGCLDYRPEYGYASVDRECMKKYYSKQFTPYVKYYEERIARTKVADMILLICIIVLGLILCCTILASKTIHGLLKQRNSALVEERKSISSIIEKKEIQSSNEKMKVSWDNFEVEVLRSWFVSRVCLVDYVICRSVLSSAVWLIVTICVIVFYKSFYKSHEPVAHLLRRESILNNSQVAIKHVSYRYYRSYATPIYPLLSFIMVGWVVICWRWLATQLYWSPRYDWKRWLCWEDFWTSHTVQLIDMYDLLGKRQQFQKLYSKRPWLNKLQSLPTRIFTKIRLHKLLYLVLMIQVCVVFFSKVCGLLSSVIVGELAYWCCKFVSLCRKSIMKEEEPVISHERYTQEMECLCMPGEDPSALLEANKMSFNKAKRLMKKGCAEGSSSEEINSMFRQYSMQWVEEGTQLLKQLKERAIPSVSSHFPSVEKQNLKMTIVSLITILIGLHKAKSDRLTKVVKACREVWDLVSFAEECDIDVEADKINLIEDLNKDNDQVCMAANMEFYELQMKYEKLPSKCEDCVLDSESVHAFLEHLLKKCEEVLRRENILEGNKMFPKDLHDSRNWTKISSSYNLYKLCKLIQDEDIQDFVAWTEKSLRNVIACSMSKLPEMIVKQCWIWAQEFEEDKLWEALQLAGKCRGLMEEWGREPKTKGKTKQPKTLYQRFKMCILCRPVDELSSGGDQTVNNTEQCTIEVKESPNQGVLPETR